MSRCFVPAGYHSQAKQLYATNGEKYPYAYVFIGAEER